MARSTGRRATKFAALIGLNVRMLREGRGESQQRFAQHAGFNRANLNRLEKGLRDPTLATLAKIAEALGVEAWELLCDSGLSITRSTAAKCAKQKKQQHHPRATAADRPERSSPQRLESKQPD
jgi:transcriptional regulator with XRE-family HTH domain